MSYEVKLYYTDPLTGNGNGNLCDWGPNHENLVQKDSLVITDLAWGSGFKPAMNTASMTLTWDSVLVSRLMHTLDNPDLFTGPNLAIQVVGESDFRFTGYLRPTGDLTYSEGGTIRLEAVDTTVKLESTYEGEFWGLTDASGFKVLDADTSKSLVHKLLEFAGWSKAVILPDQGARVVKSWNGTAWVETTISTPGIEDKVRMYALKRGESIQERLASVLFDYGYVPHARGNGDLEFLQFVAPTSTAGVPEYSEEALPMIREFKVKKRDPKFRAVSVGYQTYKVSPSLSKTSMLNKTLYPEYRIHEWNQTDFRCWPPETNRDGAVSNIHAFRTAKDAGGDSLGYEDILEPWMDPGIKSASNWFFTPSHAVIRYKLQYKIDTNIFGIPTGQEEREDQYWFVVYPNGTSSSGSTEAWKNDLVKSYVHSVNFVQNGIQLKLKRPSTHPWTHEYALIITAVQVYGGVSYLFHSRESTDDVTAPRVRSGSDIDSKLTKSYVSPMLIDPVRAKKLSDAIFMELSGNEITFKTLFKATIGSVIRVRHIGKGFDAFARVTKVSSMLGFVEVFTITAESISVTTYVEPMLSDPYTAPGEDGGNQFIPESILSAISADGKILQPILGANLPAGLTPIESGLYFLKEHLGFYAVGYGWRSRISEDGSAQFRGKFEAGDGTHTLEFDPDTGVLKLRGELQVDGDSKITGSLRSDNYEEGKIGFKIDEFGNGEFHNLVARGDLKSNSFTTIQGRVVDGGLQSDNFTAMDGWKLTPGGKILAYGGLKTRLIDFHSIKSIAMVSGGIGSIFDNSKTGLTKFANAGGFTYVLQLGTSTHTLWTVDQATFTSVRTYANSLDTYVVKDILTLHDKLYVVTGFTNTAGTDFRLRLETTAGTPVFEITGYTGGTFCAADDFLYLTAISADDSKTYTLKIDWTTGVVLGSVIIRNSYMGSTPIPTVVFDGNLYVLDGTNFFKVSLDPFEIISQTTKTGALNISTTEDFLFVGKAGAYEWSQDGVSFTSVATTGTSTDVLKIKYFAGAYWIIGPTVYWKTDDVKVFLAGNQNTYNSNVLGSARDMIATTDRIMYCTESGYANGPMTYEFVGDMKSQGEITASKFKGKQYVTGTEYARWTAPLSLTGTWTIDFTTSTDIASFPISGNTTLAFTNPINRSIRLLVNHSLTTTYSVTFPAGCRHVGRDGTATKAYSLVFSATQRTTIFDIYYDGGPYGGSGTYYVFEGKFHA